MSDDSRNRKVCKRDSHWENRSPRDSDCPTTTPSRPLAWDAPRWRALEAGCTLAHYFVCTLAAVNDCVVMVWALCAPVEAAVGRPVCISTAPQSRNARNGRPRVSLNNIAQRGKSHTVPAKQQLLTALLIELCIMQSFRNLTTESCSYRLH